MRIAAIPDLGASTSFFLPGTRARGQEREYGRLRACAQEATGSMPLDSRIKELACRIGGHDCTIEVGGLSPVDGTGVVAILDLGRHLPYGVFTTADTDAPALLVGKRVYAVTCFS